MDGWMSVNTVYEVVDGIKSIEVVLDDKKRGEKESSVSSTFLFTRLQSAPSWPTEKSGCDDAHDADALQK
jgi:hypothetical protein